MRLPIKTLIWHSAKTMPKNVEGTEYLLEIAYSHKHYTYYRYVVCNYHPVYGWCNYNAPSPLMPDEQAKVSRWAKLHKDNDIEPYATENETE